MEKARKAAEHAIRLDPDLAEPYASLGFIATFYDWDHAHADRFFQKSIELNPAYPTAHHWYSLYLVQLVGGAEEAIAEGKRALELDPLSLIINTDLALAYYHARQYEKAAEQAHRALELDPNFALAFHTLGLIYSEMGKHSEAIAALRKATALDPDNPVLWGDLGRAYARAGDRAEARRILEKLREASKQRYVAPETFVAIYAALGEKDLALQWLETAYDNRSSLISGLKTTVSLDPLRSHPRFQELTRRAGF
jgi:tetratricopeptide (TPR) repeat protein